MENSLQSDLLKCYYLSMYLCFLLNKHLGVVFINLGFYLARKLSTQPGNPRSDQSLTRFILKIKVEECKTASNLYSNRSWTLELLLHYLFI